MAFAAFGSPRPVASQIRGIYNADLFADIKSCVTVNVMESEQICDPVCSTAIPHCLIEQLSHVPLVTTPVDNNLTIDLLVGLDYYYCAPRRHVFRTRPGSSGNCVWLVNIWT